MKNAVGKGFAASVYLSSKNKTKEKIEL